MLPAWILTILSLSEECHRENQRSCYCQEPVPWHQRQRPFEKPVCIYTVPLAHMALLKRAVLMQVMVPSGSLVLCFHCPQMFNEVPLLTTSPGCIKAEDTVENALRPETSERPTCYTVILFKASVSLESRLLSKDHKLY